MKHPFKIALRNYLFRQAYLLVVDTFTDLHGKYDFTDKQGRLKEMDNLFTVDIKDRMRDFENV